MYKSPEKQRTKDIRVPVNIEEDREVKALAQKRGIPVAELVRDLVRRECQKTGVAKKTEAA